MKNKVIQICDYGHIQGGASQVAINTSIILNKSEYFSPLFFCSKGPVDKILIESGVEYICTNQNDVNNSKPYEVINNYFWNKFNYRYIYSIANKYDKKSTIFHIHSTIKSLTSSVTYFLLKNNYKVVMTMHDYFYDCPNGGLFNYPENKICKLKPLSFKCLITNCDSRNYPIKVIRFMRSKHEKYLINSFENKITFIHISKKSEQLFKALHPKCKSFLIPNPIKQASNRHLLKGLSKKYLFVGRLSKEKGVLQLARACKKLDLDITFVGDGDCRDEIHQIYPRAKITGWINSQDEIDNYIRHSRMVIFPSLWYETFGLVVLDSMKYGVPAIVSSHSTASEFIKHKFNGLLFDTSDPKNLVEALRIAEDDETVIKMRCNLEDYDLRQYTEESYLENLEKVYTTLM